MAALLNACPAKHGAYGRICRETGPHDLHQGVTPDGNYVSWSGSAPDDD